MRATPRSPTAASSLPASAVRAVALALSVGLLPAAASAGPSGWTGTDGPATGSEVRVPEADARLSPRTATDRRLRPRAAPEPGGEAPVLLVVNKSDHTLSLVDPRTGREHAVVPTGHGPHEVGVSHDGRYAFVTDYGSRERPGSTVTVIDLQRRAVHDTISLGRHTRPHGIDVLADGTFWVTTEGSRHVLHVDPSSGEILQAVHTGQDGTHMVAAVEEAGRVYAASIGSGTVTSVDAETGEVLAQISTGPGAEGIDVSPDGTRVYVVNRAEGTLSEISVATNRVTRTLEVGDFPIRVSVLPDGGEALVSNARANEVALVDLDGWNVAKRLPVGAVPVGNLVRPDGQVAYVANTRADRISVVDLEAWERSGEIVAGDEPDGMAWVP